MADETPVTVITPAMAWQMRQRGLLLPVGARYGPDARLAFIAYEQHQLQRWMDELDKQIEAMTKEKP